MPREQSTENKSLPTGVEQIDAAFWEIARGEAHRLLHTTALGAETESHYVKHEDCCYDRGGGQPYGAIMQTNTESPPGSARRRFSRLRVGERSSAASGPTE